MDSENIKYLLSKFKAGTASEEEKAFLELWYAQFKATDGSDYILAERLGDANEIWNNLPIHTPAKNIKLWPRYVSAVAAVAAIVFGIWFYTHEVASSRKAARNEGMVVNDVAPGKNTATLTLANGKTINLSDAKTGVVIGDDLKYSDNTFVVQSGSEGSGSLGTGDNVQTLTASTPRGGTYQVTLPDGTKVWLNADSKLEFPSNFGDAKQRIVKLTGEGYFEVAKSYALFKGRRIKQAFIVKSKVQETEVLGTHFNISAYGDESGAKTTLLEGSVRVKSFAMGSRINEVILKPNQQAAIHELALLVKDVDPETAVAWKDGFFKFNEERLDDIMMKVARWYNVEIVFAEPGLQWKTFNGTVSRFANISQLLKKLELTGAVHFKIEGRKIIVDK